MKTKTKIKRLTKKTLILSTFHDVLLLLAVELPVEPRMGQAFTYRRPAPEVSPDEGFRREPKRR